MSVELLAPAGDFATALAAFDAGADAVYCGLGSFSARAFAKNFTTDDLKSILRVARAKGKKVYVTFNTVVDEADMERAVRALSELDALRPDALIVQDLGVARICREYFPGLALHASTQLVAHNLEGVLALKDLGFTRVVTARELTAEEVAGLVKRSGGMEFECFVHGALCYSLSGLCLFSAMEKGRSGNRGACAYCCRLPYETEEGGRAFAFSMKDLRLGGDVRRLVAAGVSSLKIEGRMKSALYVASVTRYYRQILDRVDLGSVRVDLGSGRVGIGSDSFDSKTQGDPNTTLNDPTRPYTTLNDPKRPYTTLTDPKPQVTLGDLETVFSRRTTELYLDGRPSKSPVIDPESLGHLGAAIGTVKRVTRDREGRAWLRFHTSRALERHDGIQLAAPDGGKPLGFGISMMRPAISRTPVFEVAAGTDVEVLVVDEALAEAIRPGATVYCSMSNAVKRMFPQPSYRPADYPGDLALDATVSVSRDSIVAIATKPVAATARVEGSFTRAEHPERTASAVRAAFAKLGGTDYRLGELMVEDPDGLFAPPRLLNDLRRELVEALDAAREDLSRARLDAALADEPLSGVEPAAPSAPVRRLKLRVGQKVPAGDWAEIILAVSSVTAESDLSPYSEAGVPLRLALPVFTPEAEFGRLRVAVKRLLRAGYAAWEAADLATLRLLRALGVADLTADWTLYAFNASALRQVADLGARRVVASPENGAANLAFLAESGFPVECLAQQTTPLFMSLTRPAAVPASESGLAVFERDGLWITARRLPRTFDVPTGASARIDLSWSPA